MQPKKTPHLTFAVFVNIKTDYWRRRELGEMTSIMRFLMHIFHYLSWDGPWKAITVCNQRCYYDQSSKHNLELVFHRFLKTTKPPIIVSSARQTKRSVSLRMVKKMSLFIYVPYRQYDNHFVRPLQSWLSTANVSSRRKPVLGLVFINVSQ